MGFFDGETEVILQAAGSVDPLIPDEDKHDTLNGFVYDAITGNKDVSPNIVAATGSGLPFKARQYFQYGEKHYIWGLPEYNFSDLAVVSPAIQAIIGTDKTILGFYTHKRAGSMEALERIAQLPWWDHNYYRPIKIPSTFAVNHWGDPKYQLRIAQPLDFFTQQVIEVNGVNPPVTWTSPPVFEVCFNIDWSHLTSQEYLDLAAENEPDDFVWKTTATKGSYYESGHYVIYVNTSDLYLPRPVNHPVDERWPPVHTRVLRYPSVELPTPAITTRPFDFFPLAHLVVDNNSYETSSDWETSITKLLRRISVEPEDLLSAFNEIDFSSEMGNPISKDFSIAFLVPLRNNERTSEYAFAFAEEVAKANFLTIAALQGLQSQQLLAEAEYEAAIEEANANQYDNPFATFGLHEPDLFAGYRTFAEIYESGIDAFKCVIDLGWIVKHTSTISHADAQAAIRAALRPQDEPDANYWGDPWYFGKEQSGSTITYVVYFFSRIDIYYWTSLNGEGAGFNNDDLSARVPLSMEILDRFSFREREQILQESLCSIVSALYREEVNIPWYATGIGQMFVVIVTAIVVVVTQQYQLIAALGTAVGGGFAATVATFALKAIIGTLVSMSANIVFGDSILADIVTALVMMAVVSPTNFAALVSDPFSGVIKSFVWNSADSMFSNVFKLYNIGSKFINYQKTQELEDEYEDLLKSEEEKTLELEDAYNGSDYYGIDGTIAVSQQIFFGVNESYDEFMNRKLDTNPGVKTLDGVSRYVEAALTLPRDVRGTSANNVNIERG